MMIYEIAEVFGTAHDKAMTSNNIKSGFAKNGIFPYDRNIFMEDILPVLLRIVHLALLAILQFLVSTFGVCITTTPHRTQLS